MYDSTDCNAIPTDVVAVAGYIDGALYTWPETCWNRWDSQKTRILRISVWGPWNEGDILDIETGDATPAQAGPWATNRIQNGVVHPICYCSVSNLSKVIASLNKSGVRSQCYLWVADPTGVPHIYPGSDATQYGWNGTGGNYDLSLCQPWFGA